jgi:hypothetical protein
MEQGFKAIINLDFKNDKAELKDYLTKRLLTNDISSLLNYTNKNITPECYVYLNNRLPTSLPVERSFSMLKKMCNYNRNFRDENICAYFSNYYNRFE